ncbi:MAG: bifunctional hydroxymethylpyrimidine kinase/phosphomethylpyrimidine kinase [Deltaproteobacteria bacterium]|nr:bifunctional hydroxymethylpyrimidine kinase/phosphomethylpyrimidine kinase [Deltaproteobacteria bacterium]
MSQSRSPRETCHDAPIVSPRPVVLTIAGSDPSGGAGIQADLKTFHQHQVYGASVITVITAQNARGVTLVAPLAPALVCAQLRAVLSDLPVRAIKLGALGTHEILAAVTEILCEIPDIPLIVDPVLLSKNNHALLSPDARATLRDALCPRATLLTPNLPEAHWLTSDSPYPMDFTDDSLTSLAHALLSLGPAAVLLKGGHRAGDTVSDALYHQGQVHTFSHPRIATRHTHGTGCTLSAAIAARLALGSSLPESVQLANDFVHRAIAAAPGYLPADPSSVGPLDHFVHP